MSEGPPPYRITPNILTRVAYVAEAVGRAEGSGLSRDLRLRRINRIRTIQGSLAIEGNILNEEQVATILDGKAAPRIGQESKGLGARVGARVRGKSRSTAAPPSRR